MNTEVGRMKIPAVWFFLFWAVISITFLFLGFTTLDETELSNSVSPVVMFLFKFSILTISFFSLTYGMFIRPKWQYGVHRSYFWMVLGVFLSLIQCTIVTINIISFWGFLSSILIKNSWLFHFLPNMKIFTRRYSLIMIFCILSSSVKWFPFMCIPILPLINLILISGEYYINPPRDTRIAIQMALETSLFLITRRENTEFSNIVHFLSIWSYILLLFMSVDTNTFVSGNQLSGDDSFKEVLLPVAAKAKEKKIGKLIEFAVGSVDTVPIQNFFELTWAVIPCVAVMCLAYVTQLFISHDFGVWKFLMANVITSCTVGELKLRLLSSIAAKVKEMEMEKLIEFAIGTMGTILFQYFYKLTSFNEVLAFLYLAVTWVADLVLLGVSHDLGVLTFILENVLVGSTVSLSGLGIKTWLAYVASLLLFGLHLKLKSATVVCGPGKQMQVQLTLGTA